MALLPVGWAIIAEIRVVLGAATVAMITAVGIGCGSKTGMWMNDSGFWVISKISGKTETETLKTASAMVSIKETLGLAATMQVAITWPMV